jgi:hypothetical protein
MTDELLVTAAHRADCTFGPGFFRINLKGGGTRYCRDEREVRQVFALLAHDQTLHVDRDGYCLDGDRVGDARTPDVVDGEVWLGMPRHEAMDVVGLTDERDYARVYDQVSAAVYRRDNRAAQGGVRASIVIKKRGAPVTDVA